jgi:hypothetical protein
VRKSFADFILPGGVWETGCGGMGRVAGFVEEIGVRGPKINRLRV